MCLHKRGLQAVHLVGSAREIVSHDSAGVYRLGTLGGRLRLRVAEPRERERDSQSKAKTLAPGASVSALQSRLRSWGADVHG